MMHPSCCRFSMATQPRTQITFSFPALFRGVCRFASLSNRRRSSVCATGIMMIGIAMLASTASAQTAPTTALSPRVPSGDLFAEYIAEIGRDGEIAFLEKLV